VRLGGKQIGIPLLANVIRLEYTNIENSLRTSSSTWTNLLGIWIVLLERMQTDHCPFVKRRSRFEGPPYGTKYFRLCIFLDG